MPVTTTATLPQVSLINQVVPSEVLQTIPVAVMEKYQIAAFEMGPEVLKLAIVYPDQLKQGFYTALTDLGAKIGRKIELFQTDAAGLRTLIQQARQQTPGPVPEVAPVAAEVQPAIPETVLPVAAEPEESYIIAEAPPVPIPDKPPLFELGKTIAFNYLKRVPLDFSFQHRVVCVDYLPPDIFWFVTDGTQPDTESTIIPYIEKRNDLRAVLLHVAKEELDELLTYYKTMQIKEDHEKPKEEIKQQAIMDIPAEKTYASDVVMPDEQGMLVTTEHERGGLAGFFQKVSQNFAGHDEAALDPMPLPKVENPSAAPVPFPTPTVQPTGLPPSATMTGITPEVAPAPPANSAVVPAPPVPAAVAPKPPVSENDSEIGKLLSKPVDSVEELKGYVRGGSIPQIVAATVNFAIHEKASDIHIESFEDEVRVRYRVDGQLVDVVKLPPDIHAAVVSRIKILARARLDETRVPQDGRFDVRFENAQVDLRVSLLPTVHGEKVVMRILDKSKGIASLETLGVAGLAYENMVKAINRPFGICLATGPTGSGKSTSLYAILNRIATPNVNVSTLEDPVEYEMKGINQSQIRPKIGFTFAEGLRALLRQDPNIIMVGEIRDGETANMATQAALTGHLVLSTLHTNDAAGAIPRLTNMGIEPFLITSSLNMAMGQRLVRKICTNCKSEVSLPQGIKDQISRDIDIIATINPSDAARVQAPYKFYQGRGCDQCRGKGYQGRMGIYEVLLITEAIEELTLERASGSRVAAQAQKEGMITMYQDGLLKVIAGQTTLDEVLRETTNK